MNKLILFNLLLLNACVTPEKNTGLEVPQSFAAPVADPCELTGVYTSMQTGFDGDVQITATVSNQGGTCRVDISCGITAYLFKLNEAQYRLLVSDDPNDNQSYRTYVEGTGTIVGCSQFGRIFHTASDFNGKSGDYGDIDFFNYPNVGFQGNLIPAGGSVDWVKL